MAAFAAHALSWRRRSLRYAAGGTAVALAFAAAIAEPQSLYRYQAADGHLVYTDQRPTPVPRAVTMPAGDGPEIATGVWLREGEGEAGARAALIAVNELPSWTQIAYRLDASRNLDPRVARSGNALLPPASETRLVDLAPIDAAAPAEVTVSYQYVIGHPGARHRPSEPYRLPYSIETAYRVSQAYPDTITHSNAGNLYAVDFEMPVGTKIVAARGGVVVQASGEFHGAGTDFERLGSRANYVRILHDDGTLALYGHLSARSIRVAPGQEVARGQHIADSGNTGFSTGPHLHFVVQRNRAGATESVPVTFAGAAGIELTPATGDRLVAH